MTQEKLICPRCKNTHTQRAPGKPNDNRCIPCVQKDQAAYYQANKEKFRAYREQYKLEQCTCSRCGQDRRGTGQTGEYRCPECGLPTLHDAVSE